MIATLTDNAGVGDRIGFDDERLDLAHDGAEACLGAANCSADGACLLVGAGVGRRA